MNVFLEIFGYIGTALVILSMMMTSVIKLRIFNMCGALISLIYAVCVNTWPVAVLNACLLCINLVQTVRQLSKREELTLLSVGKEDVTLQHLLRVWSADLEKCHPDFNFQATEGARAHILYEGQQAIGFWIDTQDGKAPSGEALYLIPTKRNAAVKERALAMLAEYI